MVFKKYIKLCSLKDVLKRMKRRVTDWDKIFRNHISIKELVSRIYKELLKSSNKKTNNPIKLGKRFGQILHQKKIHR